MVLCLPRALSNVADEGLLKEGFFWIPSLAGPTTLALQKSVTNCQPFLHALCHAVDGACHHLMRQSTCNHGVYLEICGVLDGKWLTPC